MKTRLLKHIFSLIIFVGTLAVSGKIFGQSIASEDFERTSILVGSSPVAWSSTQSAAGFVTSASSPITGTSSLTFNTPTSGTTNPIMSAVLGGSAFNFNGSQPPYEWTFIYQAPVSVTPADNNGPNVSGNGWRFYFNATNSNPGTGSTYNSAFKGYYVAQDGNFLKFYYLCGNCKSRSQIGSSVSITPGSKYIIRAVRQSNSGGTYLFYADPYTGPGSFATTCVNTTQPEYDQVGSYVNSLFQASSTTSGIFKWDDLNFYQATLKLTALNNVGTGTGGNGIAAFLTQNDSQKAVFGFKATALGTVTMTDCNFSWTTTGSGNSFYFTGAKLYYSSADDVYTPAADDNSIGNVTLNYNSATIGSLSQTITNTSRNYFLVVDVNNYSSVSTATASIGLTNVLITGNSPTTIASGLSGTSFTLPATPTTWTGTTNTDWATSTNWNGGVPATNGSSSVIIPSGLSNYPTLTADKTVTTISLNNATLNLGGYNLFVSNSILANNSTITTTGNNSYLDITGGSGDRSISGTGLTVANLKTDLPLATNTLNVYAPVTITNLLTPTKGIISSGGNLTLKSTSTVTASVDVINTSNASITGNVTVQRYFTGGTIANRGWRLMSMPVNNTGTLPMTTAAAYDFSSLQTNLLITGNGSGFDVPSGYTAKGPTVLFYDTSSGRFVNLASITTTTPVGTGFYFYFRGNRANAADKVIKTGGVFATPEANVVGLQSGTLNQGSLTYSLPFTGTGTNQGVNLVGNPYASSYNVTAASLINTNNTVYTFTPGGNSVTANTAPCVVGSGQGFYVKATSSGSTITFTEANKVTTQLTGQNLLMGTPIAAQEGNIKLQLVQDSANYDFAQLRFLDSYNKNYDEQEDADDLNGNGQAVFFGAMTADNHLVAIASQPIDKQKTSVYLSINDNNSGLFTINKVNLAGIPDMYDVWLMDHFKNDSLDLRNNSTYNFNIDKNNAATYGNSRLEVVIRKKSLPPYQLITFSGKKVNLNNVLNWSTVNEYTYTSFELQSSTDGVNFVDINNSQSNGGGNYTFSDQASNTDVYYRLKQTDINDKVSYSTIVIIKADNANAVFSVYPNPVSGVLQFSLNQVAGNTLNLRIYNSLGALIKSSNFTTNSGQQDVSMLTSGSYEVQLIDNTNKKVIASAKFMKL